MVSRRSTKDLKATQKYLKSLGRGYTIKKLKSLEKLNLFRTQVTDGGLVHLKALKSLKVLFLRNTKVTDKGVKDLKKALPACEIYH